MQIYSKKKKNPIRFSQQGVGGRCMPNNNTNYESNPVFPVALHSPAENMGCGTHFKFNTNPK